MGISSTRANSLSENQERVSPAPDEALPSDEALSIDGLPPTDGRLSYDDAGQAQLHQRTASLGTTPALSLPSRSGVGARRPIRATDAAASPSVEESIHQALREDRARQSAARGALIDGMTATIPEIDANAINRVTTHVIEYGDRKSVV